MAKLFKTTFKIRRGSSQTWKKNNPILEYGEPGFDKDQNDFKIGDGVTAWNDLKYIGEPSVFDALNLVMELQLVEPLSDENNNIFVDEDNNLYVL